MNHVKISCIHISSVVDCGSLNAPPNGDVEFNTTTFESTATYSCDPPFTLSGVTFRTCLETGSWSGKPPTCQGT